MSDDLEKNLAGWLENSGRALELRTARAFRGRGMVKRVEQSMTYEDAESQKPREGDVLAVYHWMSEGEGFFVEVTAECKSKKGHPWVAFYDDRRMVPDYPALWFLRTGPRWPPRSAERIVEEWKTFDGLVTDRVATHVVSALGNDNKRNEAHDAIQQAFSFARGRVKHGPTRYVGMPDGASSYNVVVPLVVTQAPLFTCELNADGEAIITRVDGFDVWLHAGEKRPKTRVYVRSEGSLGTMADDLNNLAKRLNS